MLAGVSALECSPSFFFRPFRIVGTSLPGSNSNSYISFHTFHLHHADVYLVCQEFGITSSPDRVLAVSLFLSILPRRVVSISIFPNTKERNPIHHSSVHVKGRPDDLLLLLRTSPPLNPKIFHLPILRSIDSRYYLRPFICVSIVSIIITQRRFSLCLGYVAVGSAFQLPLLPPQRIAVIPSDT